MRLDLLVSTALSLSLLAGWAAPARAASFSLSTGASRLSAYGDGYQAKTTSQITILARYLQPLSGRWSWHAEVLSSFNNRFTGFGGGLSFDLTPRVEQIFDETVTETRDRIAVIPNWRYVAFVSGGRWRFSDIMNRAQTDWTGQNPKTAIEADVYGAILGFNVMKTLTNRWAAGLEAAQVFAYASSFSINLTHVGLAAAITLD